MLLFENPLVGVFETREIASDAIKYFMNVCSENGENLTTKDFIVSELQINNVYYDGVSIKDY